MNHGALLEAEMFPHIMDKIWSYAPNDSLMRLRCVSREFKERADLLLLDHIIFWDEKYEERPQRGREHGHLSSSFFSTTGHRLPFLYSVGGRTLLGQLFPRVRVLDIVKTAGESHLAVSVPAGLRPPIIRMWQPPGDRSGSCPAPSFVHVHFHPEGATEADILLSSFTRKLVVHFCDQDLQWLTVFSAVPGHHLLEGNVGKGCLEEVVIISAPPLVQGSKQQFKKEHTHRMDGHFDNEDNIESDDNRWDSDEYDYGAYEENPKSTALRATLHFLTDMCTRHEKPGRNMKITCVGFPSRLTKYLELNRSDICTPRYPSIPAVDYEAVLDSIAFVNHETYRREVGEEMWQLETDRSIFKLVVCEVE